MTNREPGTTHAISDTGPLISIFQSDSFDLVTAILPIIHIPSACETELLQHGWDEAIRSATPLIKVHPLSRSEKAMSWTIARRIASHPLSHDPLPENHLGEAQAMALSMRPEFAHDILLLDEMIAGAVAKEMQLKLSGFAGVLLTATKREVLTAEELKRRLEICQEQGTHYGNAFIERVYREAKKKEKKQQ